MDQVNKSALKKICSVHLHVSVFRANKNSKFKLQTGSISPHGLRVFFDHPPPQKMDHVGQNTCRQLGGNLEGGWGGKKKPSWSDGGWFLRIQGVCWLVFTERRCAGWFLLNEGWLAVFYRARVRGLDSEQPKSAGWFLRSEGALAGFYAGRVRWLVFIERGCTGWFLGNPGALAGFPRPRGHAGCSRKHIQNIKEFNGRYKRI